jgi:hypothetical protein
MEFRNLKASLVTLLGDAAAGEYRVYGYQTQPKGADEFVGKKRSVRAFYSQGDFPKSGGSLRGPFNHDVRFGLEIIVVENATMDLSVLNDPSSTATERADALAAKTDAADLADDSWDEFAELLYQTIMDARNQDLGLAEFVVGSRWLQAMKKDPPNAGGKQVILTGTLILTCSVVENVTGETPSAGELISGDINEVRKWRYQMERVWHQSRLRL